MHETNLYSVYGPVDFIRRLYNVKFKYNIVSAPHDHRIDTSDPNYEPEVKEIIESIQVKFPQLDASRPRWYYHVPAKMEGKYKDWAQQVTDMLGAYPTSAIFKNSKKRQTDEEEES